MTEGASGESRQMSPAGREALGIEGTGWDIGYAVRFLLSAEARYIRAPD
jgi:hypothetical protein